MPPIRVQNDGRMTGKRSPSEYRRHEIKFVAWLLSRADRIRTGGRLCPKQRATPFLSTAETRIILPDGDGLQYASSSSSDDNDQVGRAVTDSEDSSER
jgi:hypothetical protein